jgi:hypothetical protein
MTELVGAGAGLVVAGLVVAGAGLVMAVLAMAWAGLLAVDLIAVGLIVAGVIVLVVCPKYIKQLNNLQTSTYKNDALFVRLQYIEDVYFISSLFVTILKFKYNLNM